MIELPEAIHLVEQLKRHCVGLEIHQVTAARSPHKWAWYTGKPSEYPARLCGLRVEQVENWGSFVVLHLTEGTRLMLGEGIRLRLYPTSREVPEKHQLFVEFDDRSALVATVQMYGFMLCEDESTLPNVYAQLAREKPSPISVGFDREYFQRMVASLDNPAISVKSLLAAEQRIPGLGNGVLQDVLFRARINPRRKVQDLDVSDLDGLFEAVRDTIMDMVSHGGRDTEFDLFGAKGGYVTQMCRNTMGHPCPRCSTLILKANYLGGSVYWCPTCQPLG